MWEWSPVFATGIDQIDEEHQELFRMINTLTQEISTGLENSGIEAFDRTVNELITYAQEHFAHEERIMIEHNIDPRHLSLQKMEHHSFVYDVEKFHSKFIVSDQMTKHLKDLVFLITTWMAYHTLKVDLDMAHQIRLINEGTPPAEAYDIVRNMKPNERATRMMLNSVLDLWSEALAREHELELELKRLHAQLSSEEIKKNEE